MLIEGIEQVADFRVTRLFALASARFTAIHFDTKAQSGGRRPQSAAVWIGPEGLILRRFEQGSPYDLEELYIAPPDGRTFFARCLKPSEADAAARDFCLFLFREDDLDVELRFAPALLEHWEALTEGAHAFLARIRALGSRRSARTEAGR